MLMTRERGDGSLGRMMKFMTSVQRHNVHWAWLWTYIPPVSEHVTLAASPVAAQYSQETILSGA